MSGTIAFDLEISQPFPADGVWQEKQLGISCAAAVDSRGGTRIWAPEMMETGIAEVRLSTWSCDKIAHFLNFALLYGNRIVTYNGVGFDFPFLAEHCSNPMRRVVRHLAMRSYDPAFQQLCTMGYMISLQAMSDALGLPGKKDGMRGDIAPCVWTGNYDGITLEQEMRIKALDVLPGTLEAQNLCLDYVAQDAKATLDLCLALEKQKEVYWTTKRGTRSRYPFVIEGLLTAAECMELPEPDTSWMTNPRSRSKITDWMNTEKETEHD